MFMRLWTVVGIVLMVGCSGGSDDSSDSDTDAGNTNDSSPGFDAGAEPIEGRIINVPLEEDLTRGAVFWFGKVLNDVNYSDARVAYAEDSLRLHFTAKDLRVWYDVNADTAVLHEWDAFSVFLAPNEDGAEAFRFISQLGWNDSEEERATKRQAAYAWDGSTWSSANIAFASTAGYRGSGGINTDNQANGWNTTLEIPFASLSQSAAPEPGTRWRIAVIMHDRDSDSEAPLEDQIWPEGMSAEQPDTWAWLRFGTPSYSAAPSTGMNTVTIHNELDGDTVIDAHVGGWSDCGAHFTQTDSDYWEQWGNANYANESDQSFRNVQAQWDVADFACFSKMYITFPLQKIPAGKVIQSAQLRLFHFGNSNPPEAPTSYIQVMTVAQDWSFDTITWNNAPYAYENVSAAEVPRLLGNEPATHREWDLSYAVAQAYQAQTPLRIVLYSADGPRHTGKYFRTSVVGTEENRPTLEIVWGEPQ